MRLLFRGLVCDGASEPMRRAVLTENDRIVAVEPEIIGSAAADKVYAFRDEIIAPGFIDVHGHSEMSLLSAPDGFSKRSQGFTGEIIGNCGLSVFPVTDRNAAHLRELYAKYPVSLNWRTLPEYQAELARRGVALRVWSLCGHNTLRAAVAGYEKETLSGAELARMKELLDHTLRSGALGLSSGLLYVPGCFAPPGEIVELMRVVAAHDKVYATHLRSEGDRLLESLTETLECAAQAKLKRVQISHFKTARKANWSKLDAALELLEKYRRRGVDAHIDRYPYVESQTMLSVILPPPFDRMGDTEITERLKDAEVRRQLTEGLRSKMSAADWARLRLTGARSAAHRRFIGRHLNEIPGDPAELCLEILRDDANCATISAAGMSETNLGRILAQDFCMAGSDGNASGPDELYGNTHPRAFGTAAKFLRRLLDSGVSIGGSVRRLTALPAEFFHLDGAGRIASGNWADLTVFDPETVDSDADFASPARPARGIVLTALGGTVSV